MEWTASGLRLMVGSYEDGNERLASITYWEILE
jgi:hypothetical protein